MISKDNQGNVPKVPKVPKVSIHLLDQPVWSGDREQSAPLRGVSELFGHFGHFGHFSESSPENKANSVVVEVPTPVFDLGTLGTSAPTPSTRPAELAALDGLTLDELEALAAEGIGKVTTCPADIELILATTHAQLLYMPCQLNLLVCALDGGPAPEGRTEAHERRLAVGDQQTVAGSLDAFRLRLIGVTMHPHHAGASTPSTRHHDQAP